MPGVIELSRQRGEEVRAALLKALAEIGHATVADLVGSTGFSKDSVWRGLRRLVEVGEAVKDATGNTYSLPRQARPEGPGGVREHQAGPDHQEINHHAVILLEQLRQAADYLSPKAARDMATRCAGERISVSYQIPLYTDLIRYHVGTQINALEDIDESFKDYQARERKKLEAEAVDARQQIAIERHEASKEMNAQRAELAQEAHDWEITTARWNAAIASVERGYNEGLRDLLAWQREVQAMQASMDSVVGHSFSILPIHQQIFVKTKAITMGKEMKELGEKFRTMLIE